LKLTAYYTSTVLVVLLVFSVAVFVLFIQNMSLDFEYEGPENGTEVILEQQLVERAQDQLRNILITMDGLIIVLVAGLSYFLAGKTLQPIEVVYRRQKKFVVDAAHELRTPLAVMKTGMETVLAGKDGKKEYQKLTRDSLEEVNNLSVMVDDLLFLARSDNMRQVEMGMINLSQLVEKQIELMQSYAAEKKVNLRGEVEKKVLVNGNSLYLKRMVANLIKNAVDYNRPKGEVKVFLTGNENGIELKVTDTGVGMARSDLEHIFDRFYKADQARSGQSSGAGLGLSIVQEIVKLHRGKINIESKLDVGTMASIAFPVIH